MLGYKSAAKLPDLFSPKKVVWELFGTVTTFAFIRDAQAEKKNGALGFYN